MQTENLFATKYKKTTKILFMMTVHQQSMTAMTAMNVTLMKKVKHTYDLMQVLTSIILYSTQQHSKYALKETKALTTMEKYAFTVHKVTTLTPSLGTINQVLMDGSCMTMSKTTNR